MRDGFYSALVLGALSITLPVLAASSTSTWEAMRQQVNAVTFPTEPPVDAFTGVWTDPFGVAFTAHLWRAQGELWFYPGLGDGTPNICDGGFDLLDNPDGAPNFGDIKLYKADGRQQCGAVNEAVVSRFVDVGTDRQDWNAAVTVVYENRDNRYNNGQDYRLNLPAAAPEPQPETNPLRLTVTGPGSVTSYPTGIDCNDTAQANCEAAFTTDTRVILAAEPDSDGVFFGWDQDCAEASGLLCMLSMANARTVTANFSVALADDVSISLFVTGEGYILLPDGGLCTDVCLWHQPLGATLELMVTAAEGWEFAGWGGACAEADTATVCPLVAGMGLVLSARFIEQEPSSDQARLRVQVRGLGTVTSSDGHIDCGEDCKALYPQDTEVTLNATPDEGQSFIGWGGGCAEVQTSPTCTLTLGSDITAIAAFDSTAVDRAPALWTVAEIYIATMGYAPDDEGLQYWAYNLDNIAQWTPETVAQSFFDQPLVQEVYPAGMTDTQFINAVYMNIFGRAPDLGGLDYWTAELGSGRLQRNQMIIAMINGGWANTSPDALADMESFGNRVRVALAFAAYQADKGIAYSALDDAQRQYLRDVGRGVLLQVGPDAASRDQAIARIPGLLNPLLD